MDTTQVKHIVPRISHEEWTVAVIEYRVNDDAMNAGLHSLTKLLPKLVEATEEWVTTTDEGRACLDYACDDLNIGDLCSHGGIEFVAKHLEQYGVLGFRAEPVPHLENEPGMTYDTRLVTSNVCLADDEFRCEGCQRVFDVEDSVKPAGKKGPMYCEACAKNNPA
jgi:hypothetical protein